MFGPTTLETVCRYEEHGRRAAVYPAAERQAQQEQALGEGGARIVWPHRPRWWLGGHLAAIHERHLARLGERLLMGATVPVVAHR